MSNVTAVTIVNGVPTAPSGTVSTIDALMADGGQATLGAKADAKAATTDATPISAMSIWKQISASIQAVAASLAGTLSASISSATVAASASPTVTASAYSAGNIMGGIMTFAGLLDAVRFAGVLESITVKFKGAAVVGSVTLSLFKASPSNGTYGDKTAGTWNAADMANLIGVYTLSTPLSPQGAMTVYCLDGIGKAILGTTQSLFGIMTVAGTPTPASTSDLTVEVAMLPG